jgi:hypothetical protein
MNIDVKKLLYKYPKLKVALANIRESQSRLTKQTQMPKCTAGYGENMQGKGGLPSSTTERMALFNVELHDQHYQLEIDSEEYVYAIQLITSALETLSDRQVQLIKYSYFDEREPIIVSDLMHISLSRFYHLHKIAIDGIEQCLNSGNIFMNRLIPTKNNKSSNKNTRIYAMIS